MRFCRLTMNNDKLVFTRSSTSNNLSFEAVITRLKSRAAIKGIALFGSRTVTHRNPISDFDLLLFVDSPPVNIFQLLTHIAGRMADVVFVSTADADSIEKEPNPHTWTSGQRLYMLKMRNAQIICDKTGRLGRAQHLAQTLVAAKQFPPDSAYESVYSAWFWANFSLLHLKRMAQSDDPVYQTATDMMFLTAFSSIGKDYFVMRSLPWEGEKAAVRYWENHDPSFLKTYRECLACFERARKIAIYEQLVLRVIALRGELWEPEISAVFLGSPSQSQMEIEKGLGFWEALIS